MKIMGTKNQPGQNPQSLKEEQTNTLNETSPSFI